MRAGRHREAVARLTEGMQGAGGVHDWALPAVAHHHFGDATAAADWLAKGLAWRPAGDHGQFWDEREVEVMRGPDRGPSG